MVYFGLEYCRNFGKGFALGIDLDIYNHLPVNSVSSKERIREEVTTSFSAGIYLRINPSFFLKKF